MTWQDERLDLLGSSPAPKPGFSSNTPGNADTDADSDCGRASVEVCSFKVPVDIRPLWVAKVWGSGAAMWGSCRGSCKAEAESLRPLVEIFPVLTVQHWQSSLGKEIPTLGIPV
jgi:hypothetical protein